MNARLEALRQQWESLTEREKRLVRALGGIALALLILLPVYLLSSAIGQLQQENDDIAAVLSEITRSEERLAQRARERDAAEARYARRTPSFGDFLDSIVRTHWEANIATHNDQPEVQVGRFRKRHAIVTIPNVSLRQAVRVMNEIEASPFPVALHRVKVEHFSEGDHYNVELGVITFDRTQAHDAGVGAAPGAGGAAPAEAEGSEGRRAGPPTPP